MKQKVEGQTGKCYSAILQSLQFKIYLERTLDLKKT